MIGEVWYRCFLTSVQSVSLVAYIPKLKTNSAGHTQFKSGELFSSEHEDQKSCVE